MENLESYTWHASDALAIGIAGRWDAHWFDQKHEEKH